MRPFMLIALLAAVAAAEEGQPKPLDPSAPKDAIIIVDRITAHATWPGMDREQAVTLQLALQTLAKVVSAQEAAVVDPKAEVKPEKPVEPAAPQPKGK